MIMIGYEVYGGRKFFRNDNSILNYLRSGNNTLFLSILNLLFQTVHGRGTELLEIYSSMAGRVGDIKNILSNNFKMVKSTKKHKNS